MMKKKYCDPRFIDVEGNPQSIEDQNWITSAENGQFNFGVEADSVAGVQRKNIRKDEKTGLPSNKGQEDRIILFELDKENTDKYTTLSKENKSTLLKNTFETLSDEILRAIKAKEIVDQGSTAVVAVLEKDKYAVINLGDSEVLSLNFGKPEFKRINDLHNPEDIEEFRVLSVFTKNIKNGTIRKAIADKLNKDSISEEEWKKWLDTFESNKKDIRLGTGLALSRAMGDYSSELYGLIHKPEVYFEEYNLQKGKPHYIIVASDGLFEFNLQRYPENFSANREISDLVTNNHDSNLGEIAYLLGYEAFKRGSEDDISVLVAKITQGCVPENVRIMGVFDGHVCHEVSQFLKDNFQRVFLAHLNMQPVPAFIWHKESAVSEHESAQHIRQGAVGEIQRAYTPSFDSEDEGSTSTPYVRPADLDLDSDEYFELLQSLRLR